MLEALSSACDKKRRERKKERRTRKELVGDLWFTGAGESSQTGVVMFVPLRTWKKISGAVLDVVVACSVCWFTNTCLSWATEQRTIGFEIRSFFFYLPPLTSPGLRAIQNIQIRFFQFFWLSSRLFCLNRGNSKFQEGLPEQIFYFGEGNTSTGLWSHIPFHLQKPRDTATNPYLDADTGFHITIYEIRGDEALGIE